MPKPARASFWKRFGPGLITGASDDDPSGIATYSVAGAQAGYGLLWTSLWLLPFMAAIQEMCARIGMVTGTGVAGVIRKSHGRRALGLMAVMLLVANTLNIGADLAAMVASVRLLVPAAPIWALSAVFAVTIVVVMIRFNYTRIAGVLKWLTLALFAYVITAFVVHQDWPRLLLSLLVPHLAWNKQTIILLVGVMGTTISPYLFFWQATQEAEERHGRKDVTPAELTAMREDVYGGMFFSNLVMFFIMATTASAFYAHGAYGMATVADVASALRPIAGNGAFLLFALGAVGTGLLAIPVLAGSAGYVVAESFGWQEGLDQKFRKAEPFYLTIALSVFAGFVLTVIGLDPISMLIWTAVAYGIISPPLVLVILKISNDQSVMGPHVNSRRSNALGWGAFIIMSAGALALCRFTFFP